MTARIGADDGVARWTPVYAPAAGRDGERGRAGACRELERCVDGGWSRRCRWRWRSAPGAAGAGSSSKTTTTPLPTLPEGATEDSGTTTTMPPVYIVKAGDSLSTIAKMFGLTVDELVAVNELDDPNKIEEGQRLMIPPPTTAATTTTSRALSERRPA